MTGLYRSSGSSRTQNPKSYGPKPCGSTKVVQLVTWEDGAWFSSCKVPSSRIKFKIVIGSCETYIEPKFA